MLFIFVSHNLHWKHIHQLPEKLVVFGQSLRPAWSPCLDLKREKQTRQDISQIVKAYFEVYARLCLYEIIA